MLRAPNTQTRSGRRNRTLLLVAVQTGLRASELIHLRCKDAQLSPGAHLDCEGKGASNAVRRCARMRRGPSELDRRTPMRAGFDRSPEPARRRSQPRRTRLPAGQASGPRQWKINQLERWFAEITRQQIRRVTLRSSLALQTAIKDYPAVYHEDPRPFLWHKAADEILEDLKRHREHFLETNR